MVSFDRDTLLVTILMLLLLKEVGAVVSLLLVSCLFAVLSSFLALMLNISVPP